MPSYEIRKDGSKLWKDYNLHDIRETCRSIRVRAGEVEVAMVGTGKVDQARQAYVLLSNLVESLGISLHGKKR